MAFRRFDAGRLGKVERTPQGGVRVPAALTRVGVLTYRNPDGTTRLELRPPEEVFRADSLATLRSAPVTEGHGAWVTPENYQTAALGHVSDASVRKDGDLVAAELVLQAGVALPRLDSGELSELSCGYTLDFDSTPGVWNGQRYDGVQRNIRYNHVALLPPGGGRAGRDVALRLDSADADGAPSVAACDEFPPAPAGQEPGATRKDSRPMIIRFDGKDYDLSKPEDVAALNTAGLKLREDAAAASTRAETAEGERDAARTELRQERESFQARLDSAVGERVELRSSAARVLGAEYSFRRADGADKSAREIMLDVIRADDAQFSEKDAAGKPRTDDYLRARFDAVAEKGTRADGIGAVPRVLERVKTPPARLDGNGAPKDARATMVEANRNAWKTPAAS
jgi:hypothetical protein